MMNIKNYFLCLALFLGLGLSISPALSANETTSPPYYLTLNESYGRPFATSGFSGKKAYGLGTSLSFEYRGWDYLSLGAVYDHLSLRMVPMTASLDLDGLDLFVRVMSYKGSVEPYLLFSAGTDISSVSVPATRGTGYHARVGVGLLLAMTQEMAVDVGGSYVANGPLEQNLNYGDFHVGLQWRFGAAAAATAPAPTATATQEPPPTPTPVPSATPIATATPVPVAAPKIWPKAHTVLKSEDLFGIARLPEIYGDGFLWPLLYDANKSKIRDARVIEPGMVLTVPNPGSEKAKKATRVRARARWNKAQP